MLDVNASATTDISFGEKSPSCICSKEFRRCRINCDTEGKARLFHSLFRTRVSWKASSLGKIHKIVDTVCSRLNVSSGYFIDAFHSFFVSLLISRDAS